MNDATRQLVEELVRRGKDRDELEAAERERRGRRYQEAVERGELEALYTNRKKRRLIGFRCLAFVPLLTLSCASAPSENFDDLADDVGEVLDRCEEGDVEPGAAFVRDGSTWRFRPYATGSSRLIEAYWGGNTRQHEDLERELDRIGTAIGSNEVSLAALLALGSRAPGTVVCGPLP